MFKYIKKFSRGKRSVEESFILLVVLAMLSLPVSTSRARQKPYRVIPFIAYPLLVWNLWCVILNTHQ